MTRRRRRNWRRHVNRRRRMNRAVGSLSRPPPRQQMRRISRHRLQQLRLRRIHHRPPRHSHRRHGLVPVRDGADERGRVGLPPDVHLAELQSRETELGKKSHAVRAHGPPVDDDTTTGLFGHVSPPRPRDRLPARRPDTEPTPDHHAQQPRYAEAAEGNRRTPTAAQAYAACRPPTSAPYRGRSADGSPADRRTAPACEQALLTEVERAGVQHPSDLLKAYRSHEAPDAPTDQPNAPSNAPATELSDPRTRFLSDAVHRRRVTHLPERRHPGTPRGPRRTHRRMEGFPADGVLGGRRTTWTIPRAPALDRSAGRRPLWMNHRSMCCHGGIPGREEGTNANHL